LNNFEKSLIQIEAMGHIFHFYNSERPLIDVWQRSSEYKNVLQVAYISVLDPCKPYLTITVFLFRLFLPSLLTVTLSNPNAFFYERGWSHLNTIVIEPMQVKLWIILSHCDSQKPSYHTKDEKLN
jgi:hypothetical protein